MNKMLIKNTFAVSLALLLTWPLAVAADTLSTKPMQVSLVPAEGSPLLIGHISFTQAGDGYDYTLTLDYSKFGEHFLNMRQFKCFQGPKQMICHLPYFYSKNQHISKGDMRDLEYEFLYIHRSANDYGIEPWNGLYYKLHRTNDGLQGTLQDVDLNILAAPPAEGVSRPITSYNLQEADAEVHSYPTLLIH